MGSAGGFVPPPYPYDRLDDLQALALSEAGEVVDCSIGTPCDPVPDVAVRAIARAAPDSAGYPPSIGTGELRDAAAGWLARRLGVVVPADAIGACVGTKELVASLPHALRLRDPSRDTVLYPAVSYPTYEMGARLAGCRAVPVPLDDDWHLDLGAVDDDDARRALLLWCNEPGNPTGSCVSPAWFGALASWARDRGVVVASDECYVEYAPEPASVLAAGRDGVLAVHSVSKRSNLAGLRVGFYAGDDDLVGYLHEVRKHAGMIVPTVAQAAAAATLADDAHVDVQRARYARRRALVIDALAAHGIEHAGGPMTFYLWLRAADGADGWEIGQRLARAGLLVAPGDLYGPAGARFARMALVCPRERLGRALGRLGAG